MAQLCSNRKQVRWRNCFVASRACCALWWWVRSRKVPLLRIRVRPSFEHRRGYVWMRRGRKSGKRKMEHAWRVLSFAYILGMPWCTRWHSVVLPRGHNSGAQKGCACSLARGNEESSSFLNPQLLCTLHGANAIVSMVQCSPGQPVVSYEFAVIHTSGF